MESSQMLERYNYFQNLLKQRDKEVEKITETYVSCGVELAIDIYLPDRERYTGLRPGVLFFFGGGFMMGSRDAFGPQAEECAREGFVALCADYRVKALHGTEPNDSILDGVAAWLYTRENASRWGLNPDQIALSGGSAGGLISAMIGPVSGIQPAALVLYNPAINLRGLPGEILQKLVDGELNGVPYPSVDTLTEGMPPTLIMHGQEDDTIPLERMEAYADQSRKLGNQVKLVTYPGVNHGFFNYNRSRPHYFMTLGEALLFLDQAIGDNRAAGNSTAWAP